MVQHAVPMWQQPPLATQTPFAQVALTQTLLAQHDWPAMPHEGAMSPGFTAMSASGGW
jgi:hypothetical protein